VWLSAEASDMHACCSCAAAALCRAAASEAEPGVATAELHFGSLLAALAKQLLDWRSQDPNFKVPVRTHVCVQLYLFNRDCTVMGLGLKAAPRSASVMTSNKLLMPIGTPGSPPVSADAGVAFCRWWWLHPTGFCVGRLLP
jgi:hypothetical protein